MLPSFKGIGNLIIGNIRIVNKNQGKFSLFKIERKVGSIFKADLFFGKGVGVCTIIFKVRCRTTVNNLNGIYLIGEGNLC